MKKVKIHILECCNLPIFRQLQIEEALLRGSQENWCVLNSGSPLAIVMGISGKVNDLLYLDKVNADNVPVIQRFTGGGTVVVDESTLFASFIMNKEGLEIECFPDHVHAWAEQFYQNIFTDQDFRLRENDYVFGKHKFGGNAQYLRKDRWLHHTTFLWEFDPKNMEYLKIPAKAPNYREGRSHADFLCRLSQRISKKSEFFERVCLRLSESFEVKVVDVTEATLFLDKDHRKTTKIVETKKTLQEG